MKAMLELAFGKAAPLDFPIVCKRLLSKSALLDCEVTHVHLDRTLKFGFARFEEEKSSCFCT